MAEFRSTAEQNRKEYEAELKNTSDVEEEPTVPDLEEDLDFLLSLKEPVLPIPINIPVRDIKSTAEGNFFKYPKEKKLKIEIFLKFI